MTRLRVPVGIGIACAALAAGVVMADGLSSQKAAAQAGGGGLPVTGTQLLINQRISQAAVRRSNTNTADIAQLKAQAPVPGPQGPAGPPGPPGPPGSDASVNGVPAGGALSGTYPDPGLAAGAVGNDQVAPGSLGLDRLALQLRGTFNLGSVNVPAEGCWVTLGNMSVPRGALVIQEPLPNMEDLPGGLYMPTYTSTGLGRAIICNPTNEAETVGPVNIRLRTLGP